MHIERHGTEEVEGIDVGVTYIFPKIDGTNSSIWRHDGTLWAGSRNRLLSLESDNAGFYNWVLQNEAMFMQYFSQHMKYRLYGEWLVPHTLKSYREDAWRKFWVFDVYDDELNQHIPYDIYAENLAEFGIDCIPPSNIIKNPTQEQLLNIVNSNTFLIQDGAGAGEGIVIKNYDYQNKFGRQTWSKIVRNEFKEANKKTFGLKEQDGRIQIESQIAEKYVTEALVNKTRAKIVNDGITDRKSLIPRLLQTVFHDLVQEEIWTILKEYKNPIIDFKRLNNFVIHCTKNWAKDLF